MKRIENASSKQCHGSSVEADPEEEAWPKNGFRCQSLSSYQKWEIVKERGNLVLLRI